MELYSVVGDRAVSQRLPPNAPPLTSAHTSKHTDTHTHTLAHQKHYTIMLVHKHTNLLSECALSISLFFFFLGLCRDSLQLRRITSWQKKTSIPHQYTLTRKWESSLQHVGQPCLSWLSVKRRGYYQKIPALLSHRRFLSMKKIKSTLLPPESMVYEEHTLL